MMKWIFIALGVVLISAGIGAYLDGTTNAINEDAIVVDVQKAISMLDDPDRHFVTVTGKLDDSKHFYPTFIKQPEYSDFLPWEVQDEIISASNFNRENINAYLGAHVKVDMVLEPSYMEIQYIREKHGDKTLISRTAIAPFKGTNRRLWILSPGFHYNSPDKKKWLSQTSFTGKVSRFSDLDKNVKNLEYSESQIRSFVQRKMNGHIPTNAILLLAHRGIYPERDKQRLKYYVMVEDSDRMLFVKTNLAGEAAINDSGKITGILDDRNSYAYQELTGSVGYGKQPERIGIITTETAKEVNDEAKDASLVGFIGGSIFLLFSFFLFRRARG